MLAQDVENTVRAKPNTSLGQIPPTGGVLRPQIHTDTHTHTQIDTHVYTDIHTNTNRHTDTRSSHTNRHVQMDHRI